MLSIVTSKTIEHQGRRPIGPYSINWGSPQSQGLVLWVPMGNYQGLNEIDLIKTKTFTANGTPERRVATNHGLNISCVASAFESASSRFYEADVAPVTAVPLSLCVWGLTVRTDTAQTFLSICRNATSFEAFLIRVNTTSYEASSINGGTTSSASAASTVTANVWAHLVGVFDVTTATDRTIYVNGRSRATNTTNRTPTNLDRTFIGCRRDGSAGTNGQFLDGSVLDARIYNRLLRPSEVHELYQPATRWDLYYKIGTRIYNFRTGGTIHSGNLNIDSNALLYLASGVLFSPSINSIFGQSDVYLASSKIARTTADNFGQSEIYLVGSRVAGTISNIIANTDISFNGSHQIGGVVHIVGETGTTQQANLIAGAASDILAAALTNFSGSLTAGGTSIMYGEGLISGVGGFILGGSSEILGQAILDIAASRLAGTTASLTGQAETLQSATRTAGGSSNITGEAITNLVGSLLAGGNASIGGSAESRLQASMTAVGRLVGDAIDAQALISAIANNNTSTAVKIICQGLLSLNASNIASANISVIGEAGTNLVPAKVAGGLSSIIGEGSITLNAAKTASGLSSIDCNALMSLIGNCSFRTAGNIIAEALINAVAAGVQTAIANADISSEGFVSALGNVVSSGIAQIAGQAVTQALASVNISAIAMVVGESKVDFYGIRNIHAESLISSEANVQLNGSLVARGISSIGGKVELNAVPGILFLGSSSIDSSALTSLSSTLIRGTSSSITGSSSINAIVNITAGGQAVIGTAGELYSTAKANYGSNLVIICSADVFADGNVPEILSGRTIYDFINYINMSKDRIIYINQMTDLTSRIRTLLSENRMIVASPEDVRFIVTLLDETRHN